MSHHMPQHNIFFEEKQDTSLNDPSSPHLPELESITYLKRGDSNKYIEQFLAKEEIVQMDSHSKNSQEKDENYIELEDQQFQPEQGTEFNTSSFHNFQKHLTVCLKKSIDIHLSEASEQYQKVAVKMWRIFQSSNISTKKILHYLLGDENEHKIDDRGLKQFGLKKIFQENTLKITKDARKYLAAQTLEQIKEGKLLKFVESKKMKDKLKFTRYIQIFVEQLTKGFLKKRLPKQKVAELSKC